MAGLDSDYNFLTPKQLCLKLESCHISQRELKAVSGRSIFINIRDSEVINQDEEYIEQEESDEWDPAIGMRDEDRKNKQNNNDLLILLSLILLCIIGIPSGLFFITRNRYKGDKDPKTIALENTIKNLGTKIKV